jgi:hypothetical protein
MIEAKYKQGQKLPTSVKCEEKAPELTQADIQTAERKMLNASFENRKFDNNVFLQPAAKMINHFLKEPQTIRRPEPKAKIECVTWLWEQ